MHSSPVLRKFEIPSFEDGPQQISRIGLCVSAAVRWRVVPTGFQFRNEPTDCRVNNGVRKHVSAPSFPLQSMWTSLGQAKSGHKLTTSS